MAKGALILSETFGCRSNIKDLDGKSQILLIHTQGQTGRVFQLRVGSGSGIEKIFRVGLGIGYLYQIPSQLGIMGY